MKLTKEYLEVRHAYWKERLDKGGIWDAGKFGKVTLVVRPACKSYNGMFIRRYLKVKGERKLTDRIFIYEKVEDFEEKFLDSILVHEMIHQYIIQNKIKDSSPHGKIFREYMKRINERYGEELRIKISDRNPGLPSRGTGLKKETPVRRAIKISSPKVSPGVSNKVSGRVIKVRTLLDWLNLSKFATGKKK